MQRYIAASGWLLVSLLVHTVAALLCFIQLVDGENSEKINIHYQFSQNADVERYQDIQVNFHFSVSYWLFQSVPCFLHPCTQVKPYKSIVSDERICVFFSQCRLAAAAAEKRKRESLDVRMRHFKGGILRTHASSILLTSVNFLFGSCHFPTFNSYLKLPSIIVVFQIYADFLRY